MTKRKAKRKRRPPKKLCGANKTDGSGKCGHPAGWGVPGRTTGPCKKHGGATRSHRVAAQKAELQEAVAEFGLPRSVSPDEALLEELHRTAGLVHFLGQLIGKLKPDEMVFGLAKDSAKSTADVVAERRVERRAGLVPLVRWFQQERRHYVNVATRAIAAGIAERQVRIAEQEASIFAAAMRGMFDDLGVADHPKLGTVVRKHMRLIRGGKA